MLQEQHLERYNIWILYLEAAKWLWLKVQAKKSGIHDLNRNYIEEKELRDYNLLCFKS